MDRSSVACGRPHSMTSSALISSEFGTVRPRALPVFKLTTSLKCVGCSMGRSAGFAPLRILSVYATARRKKSGKSGPYDNSGPKGTISATTTSIGIFCFKGERANASSLVKHHRSRTDYDTIDAIRSYFGERQINFRGRRDFGRPQVKIQCFRGSKKCRDDTLRSYFFRIDDECDARQFGTASFNNPRRFPDKSTAISERPVTLPARMR